MIAATFEVTPLKYRLRRTRIDATKQLDISSESVVIQRNSLDVCVSLVDCLRHTNSSTTKAKTTAEIARTTTTTTQLRPGEYLHNRWRKLNSIQKPWPRSRQTRVSQTREMEHSNQQEKKIMSSIVPDMNKKNKKNPEILQGQSKTKRRWAIPRHPLRTDGWVCILLVVFCFLC